MPTDLDDRDHRILALLQADAWLSYAALSEAVNLSPSAVQRRVERMIAAGVIVGARAEVTLTQAEPPVIVFVLAELKSESREALSAFSTQIAANGAVVEAWYTAGESDVVLKLHLPDMAAYDRFVDHLNASGLVRRFKTLTVLRTLAPDRAAKGA
ncbi:MAG TPA: Lrp/AsnC family transcriptional regulator [Caulobacteraceae bacterium]|jgi:Lrp/AsnC family transcriptional regulator